MLEAFLAGAKQFVSFAWRNAGEAQRESRFSLHAAQFRCEQSGQIGQRDDGVPRDALRDEDRAAETMECFLRDLGFRCERLKLRAEQVFFLEIRKDRGEFGK